MRKGTDMIYARDLPSGVNAHISGDAIGVSAGGNHGITGETDMTNVRDWSL